VGIRALPLGCPPSSTALSPPAAWLRFCQLRRFHTRLGVPPKKSGAVQRAPNFIIHIFPPFPPGSSGEGSDINKENAKSNLRASDLNIFGGRIDNELDAGGKVLAFKVTSLPMLNRLFSQELQMKACRCPTLKCQQRMDLTIRKLRITKKESLFRQLGLNGLTMDKE
jgi:hypothetical protein